MKQKYGLIGTGIQDSCSPALFKAAYHGKWAYELLDGDDFDSLYARAKKDYAAVNVTAPFKELALSAADEASEEALLCGAANMLIRKNDGSFIADNSDFEGVTLSLMSAYAVAGVDVDDEDAFADFLSEKTALVLGCSGAGKAAAAACLTLGFGKTVLINRTREKAEKLRKHLSDFYGDVFDDELEVRDFREASAVASEADLIIYTLPCPIGLEWDFRPEQTILEANYKTPCLEQYSGRCCYVSGFNWLLNQALVSYEAFTGEEPDEEAMKQVPR